MVSTQGSCRNEQQGDAVDELLEIQRKLIGEWLVDGVNGFIRYLDALRVANQKQTSRGPAKLLDLIDHSVFGHDLSIGGRTNGIRMTKDWLLKNQSVVDGLRATIATGIVSGIRLLGCRTGCDGGRQNLVDISDMFCVPVWGTTRLTDRCDYSESGIITRPGLFVASSSLSGATIR
ncbi:MAG: hypothetical protein JNK64_12920 [Myxococcales bacterium]|nr:hypothetical protein [Myxococcales bacterium]